MTKAVMVSYVGTELGFILVAQRKDNGTRMVNFFLFVPDTSPAYVKLPFLARLAIVFPASKVECVLHYYMLKSAIENMKY